MGRDLRAQATRPEELPFTDDELFEAFRIGATDAEARERVAALRRWQAAIRAALQRGSAGMSESEDVDGSKPAFGLALGDDTLIILSLLGPETAEKVERLLAAGRGGRPPDPAVDHDWRERREELRPWVEQLRRERPPG